MRRVLERWRFMREHRWTHAHMSEYLDEELADPERRRVAEHVGVCPQCRRVLATLRRTLGALHGLGGPSPPKLEDGILDRLRDHG